MFGQQNQSIMCVCVFSCMHVQHRKRITNDICRCLFSPFAAPLRWLYPGTVSSPASLSGGGTPSAGRAPRARLRLSRHGIAPTDQPCHWGEPPSFLENQSSTFRKTLTLTPPPPRPNDWSVGTAVQSGVGMRRPSRAARPRLRE